MKEVKEEEEGRCGGSSRTTREEWRERVSAMETDDRYEKQV